MSRARDYVAVMREYMVELTESAMNDNEGADRFGAIVCWIACGVAIFLCVCVLLGW